jgi:hypothetical protein
MDELIYPNTIEVGRTLRVFVDGDLVKIMADNDDAMEWVGFTIDELRNIANWAEAQNAED